MTIEQATAIPKRRQPNAITCGRCPKFDKNYCVVFAKFVGRMFSACKYGHVLISAAKQAEKKKGNAK